MRLAVGDNDDAVPTSKLPKVPEQRPESPKKGEISALSNPFIVLPTENLELAEEEELEEEGDLAVVHPLGADPTKTTSSTGSTSSSVQGISGVGSILNGSFLFSSEDSTFWTTIETTLPTTTSTSTTNNNNNNNNNININNDNNNYNNNDNNHNYN